MFFRLNAGVIVFSCLTVLCYLITTMFYPGLWIKGGILDVFPSRFITGHVEKFWFKSQLSENRRIWVYLPPGYNEESDSYPVLYVHDGQWAFDGRNGATFGMEFSVDETLEQGIKEGLFPPVIVVGIQSFLTGQNQRSNEFLPIPYQDGTIEIGGGASLYARMVIDEIMPLINEKYRTLIGPQYTTTVGFGYGANLSYYLAVNHFNLFGSVIAHSPDTFYGQQWLTTYTESLPEKLPIRIWVDIGSSEVPNEFQMDFQFTAFVESLRSKGWISPFDFSHQVEPGGYHSASAVARRFPIAVEWLFRTNAGGA